MAKRSPEQRRKAAYMKALYWIRDQYRDEFERRYQHELEDEFGREELDGQRKLWEDDGKETGEA